MDLAFLGLLALVIGVSVGGGTLTSWKLHRRTLALEYRLSDVEERLTTVGNRAKAEKRWSKKELEDEELKRFLQTENPKPARARFANDPIEAEF